MKLPKSLTTITPLSKLLAAVLFITFPLVGFYLGMNYQALVNESSQTPLASLPTPHLSNQPYPTVRDKQNETTNWKIYEDQEWNVEFKYPVDYEVVKDKDNISVINKAVSSELLSISKNLTDYQSMRRCEAEKDWQQPLPCLWTSITIINTDKEIEEILFNGVQTKSFYLQESIVRSNIHVLQTKSNPPLELRLDRNLHMDQILSTFKFLDEVKSNPAGSQLLSTPALIEQASNNGEITKDQRLLYLAYAVYEYESLPPEFQSNVGWHGTSVVEEIKETAFSPKMCELSLKTQEGLRRLLGGGENCSK